MIILSTSVPWHKWHQEPPRKLILSILVPWLQNGIRKLPGGSFRVLRCLGRQMATGGTQEVRFEYLGSLASKWHQEFTRRFILRTSVPRPPNGPWSLPGGSFLVFGIAPGGTHGTHFEHFCALAAKWPQELPRSPPQAKK